MGQGVRGPQVEDPYSRGLDGLVAGLALLGFGIAAFGVFQAINKTEEQKKEDRRK